MASGATDENLASARSNSDDCSFQEALVPNYRSTSPNMTSTSSFVDLTCPDLLPTEKSELEPVCGTFASVSPMTLHQSSSEPQSPIISSKDTRKIYSVDSSPISIERRSKKADDSISSKTIDSQRRDSFSLNPRSSPFSPSMNASRVATSLKFTRKADESPKPKSPKHDLPAVSTSSIDPCSVDSPSQNPGSTNSIDTQSQKTAIQGQRTLVRHATLTSFLMPRFVDGNQIVQNKDSMSQHQNEDYWYEESGLTKETRTALDSMLEMMDSDEELIDIHLPKNKTAKLPKDIDITHTEDYGKFLSTQKKQERSRKARSNSDPFMNSWHFNSASFIVPITNDLLSRSIQTRAIQSTRKASIRNLKIQTRSQSKDEMIPSRSSTSISSSGISSTGIPQLRLSSHKISKPIEQEDTKGSNDYINNSNVTSNISISVSMASIPERSLNNESPKEDLDSSPRTRRSKKHKDKSARKSQKRIEYEVAGIFNLPDPIPSPASTADLTGLISPTSRDKSPTNRIKNGPKLSSSASDVSTLSSSSSTTASNDFGDTFSQRQTSLTILNRQIMIVESPELTRASAPNLTLSPSNQKITKQKKKRKPKDKKNESRSNTDQTTSSAKKIKRKRAKSSDSSEESSSLKSASSLISPNNFGTPVTSSPSSQPTPIISASDDEYSTSGEDTSSTSESFEILSATPTSRTPNSAISSPSHSPRSGSSFNYATDDEIYPRSKQKQVIDKRRSSGRSPNDSQRSFEISPKKTRNRNLSTSSMNKSGISSDWFGNDSISQNNRITEPLPARRIPENIWLINPIPDKEATKFFEFLKQNIKDSQLCEAIVLMHTEAICSRDLLERLLHLYNDLDNYESQLKEALNQVDNQTNNQPSKSPRSSRPVLESALNSPRAGLSTKPTSGTEKTDIQGDKLESLIQLINSHILTSGMSPRAPSMIPTVASLKPTQSLTPRTSPSPSTSIQAIVSTISSLKTSIVNFLKKWVRLNTQDFLDDSVLENMIREFVAKLMLRTGIECQMGSLILDLLESSLYKLDDDPNSIALSATDILSILAGDVELLTTPRSPRLSSASTKDLFYNTSTNSSPLSSRNPSPRSASSKGQLSSNNSSTPRDSRPLISPRHMSPSRTLSLSRIQSSVIHPKLANASSVQEGLNSASSPSIKSNFTSSQSPTNTHQSFLTHNSPATYQNISPFHHNNSPSNNNQLMHNNVGAHHGSSINHQSSHSAATQTRLIRFLDFPTPQLGTRITNLLFSTTTSSGHTSPPANQISVMDLSPTELARQICLLDHTSLSLVRFRDFLRFAGRPASSISLVEVANRFNQGTCWVASQILSIDNVKKRAQMAAHLIQVAEILLQLNNFHSFLAFITGLTQMSIGRLRETWKKVGKKELKSLHAMQKLASPISNFAALRTLHDSTPPPFVPSPALFLKDLVFVTEGSHKGYIDPETGEVNADKILIVEKVLGRLHQAQRNHYLFVPIQTIQDLLTNVEIKTSEELEAWSMKVEAGRDI